MAVPEVGIGIVGYGMMGKAHSFAYTVAPAFVAVLVPGAVLAAPMPRVRSILLLQAFDYNSVGGDPSRPNIHFTQVNSFINTIWSDHWWSLSGMTWDVNWNHERRTSIELSEQVGYRFDHHWAVFSGASAGVMGRDTILGQDWAVQAGVRWLFKTPLLPEQLFTHRSER